MNRTYESACFYLDQHMRSGLVSRPIRNKFVQFWVDGRISGLTEKGATKEALSETRRKYGNPLFWWAIAFILKNFIVPLLIKWWENR